MQSMRHVRPHAWGKTPTRQVVRSGAAMYAKLVCARLVLLSCRLPVVEPSWWRVPLRKVTSFWMVEVRRPAASVLVLYVIFSPA